MRNGNSKNAPSFMSDDQLKTGSAIDRMAANDDYYSGKNDEEYVVEGSSLDARMDLDLQRLVH